MLPLKLDAGKMLITAGHEAARVHSSKTRLGAPRPQSAGLNLFCTETLQQLKANASGIDSLYILFTTRDTQLPTSSCGCIGVSVFVSGAMGAFAKRKALILRNRGMFSICDAADLSALVFVLIAIAIDTSFSTLHPKSPAGFLSPFFIWISFFFSSHHLHG